MDFKKRKMIAELYKRALPKMLGGVRMSPYSFHDNGWFGDFTPIEDNVWSDIRYLGLPFFPQYPVLNYYIDFADPVKKIGIEVDGKKWHTDKQADNYRQKRIENEGWTIIRIKGRDTFKCLQEKEWENAEYEGRDSEKINCSCGTCDLRIIKKQYVY